MNKRGEAGERGSVAYVYVYEDVDVCDGVVVRRLTVVVVVS